MTKQEALEILSRNKVRLKEFRVSCQGESSPKSDIDIIVEFDKDARVDLFEPVRLKSFLSEILSAEADLVTPDALHPMLRDGIMQEAIRAA